MDKYICKIYTKQASALYQNLTCNFKQLGDSCRDVEYEVLKRLSDEKQSHTQVLLSTQLLNRTSSIFNLCRLQMGNQIKLDSVDSTETRNKSRKHIKHAPPEEPLLDTKKITTVQRNFDGLPDGAPPLWATEVEQNETQVSGIDYFVPYDDEDVSTTLESENLTVHTNTMESTEETNKESRCTLQGRLPIETCPDSPPPQSGESLSAVDNPDSVPVVESEDVVEVNTEDLVQPVLSTTASLPLPSSPVVVTQKVQPVSAPIVSSSVCPPVPIKGMKRTHFTFTLSEHLPFSRVIVELSSCLSAYKNHKFQCDGVKWIGDICTDSGSCKMKLEIFLSNPSTPQYAIECIRLSGDIAPFYSFFREFHSLLNNVSSTDLCKAEELADMSDALIEACVVGNEVNVKTWLQNKNIDINRIQPDSGKAAIHLACEHGRNKIIEILMEHKADVLLRDKRGRSPIDCAIVSKHFEVVELLLDRYDISMKVERAASEVRDDFMHKNTSTRAIPVDSENLMGCSPLSVALASGRKDATDFLVAIGDQFKGEDHFGRVVDSRIPPHDKVPTYFSAPLAPAVIAANAALAAAAAAAANTPKVEAPAVEGQAMDVVDAAAPPPVAIAPVSVGPIKYLIPDTATFITKMVARNAIQSLYHAAKYGMFSRVKEIIILHGRGFNLNAKVEDQVLVYDDHGALLGAQINFETSLYAAAFNGHADTVRLLLQARASGAIVARNGWSPIFAACKRNHTDVVRVLIAAKVDVTVLNKNGMSCINIAAFNGNLEIVKMLIAAKKHVVVVPGAPVEIVIPAPTQAQLTAQFINQPDKLGACPLHAAVQNMHFEVVQWLLQYGSNVNAITLSGITPLYIAACYGYLQVIEWLIARNVDINQPNNDGLTPLLVASHNGKTECALRLVVAGADIERCDHKNKVTPLYSAVQNNHVEIAKYLIRRGANVSVHILNGNTPLHSTCIENRPILVDMLLKAGAEVNAQTRDLGTPLYLACGKGNVEIVKTLLAVPETDVNSFNKFNVTAINIAAQNGSLEIVRLLLKRGANVIIQTNLGPTPLFISAQNGFHEIVDAVLKAGAIVDAATAEGETAMFVAAYFGHLEVLELLIAAKADMNKQDCDLRTPLWWACKNNQIKIVERLLAVGANITISDRGDLTPLAAAQKHGRVEIIQMLMTAKHVPQICSLCFDNFQSESFLPCKHFSLCVNCNLKHQVMRLSDCAICKVENRSQTMTD